MAHTNQINFLYKKRAKPQNQDTIRTNNNKTTEPRQINGQRNLKLELFQVVAVKRAKNYFSAQFIPVIHLSKAEQNERNRKGHKHDDLEPGIWNCCCWFDMAVSIKSARIFKNEIVASSITLFSIVPRDGTPNKSRWQRVSSSILPILATSRPGISES